jgi:hypothetical protein
MDWNVYKALCDSPHTFSRWMLEQSIELLKGEAALAARLATVLRGAPLEKPADHRGGALTDMFVVTLSVEEARAIDRTVAGAVVGGCTTTATKSRGLGGFREAWHEYAMYVERNEIAD